MKKGLLTGIGIFFLTVLLFVQALALVQKSPYHIVIFHLNDLHGKIDMLGKVAWLIDQERAKDHDVYFISAGDNFTGNPIVDQFRPKGMPILELYNRMGLTVMTLGNHEFDYGQKILASHMKRAAYRFVCANIKVENGYIPQPQPYTIFKTATGVRIALLGLIQVAPETGTSDTHPDKIRGIRFEDPIAAARRYAFLKKNNTVFIALTHLGFDQDVLLAQALPQLDIIIGGHSHTVVREPRETNGVMIVQAGSNGTYLGRIDLKVTGGRVLEKKAVLIDLKAAAGEDRGIRKLIDEYNDNPEMNRVILRSGVMLQGRDELGSLMTDAVCQVLNLEIAFQNNGGIRTDELPPIIRLKTLFQLDPFQNQIVRFMLTPAEIRSLIRFASEKSKGVDLQVSGLQYTLVQRTDGSNKDVLLEREGGGALDENRKYSVGLSSYLASAYRFEHQDPGTSLFVTSTDCLIRFLEGKPDLAVYKGVVRARLKIDNRP